MKITLTIEEGKEDLVINALKNLNYITEFTIHDEEGNL